LRIEADPDANIVFGDTILDEMDGRGRVCVVAIGNAASSPGHVPSRA
jgi:cell division GTPase FtsZ